MRKLAIFLALFALFLLLPSLALAGEGGDVPEIPYEVNATTFTGGKDYISNHLELAFIRPWFLDDKPVDLYISITQPAWVSDPESGNTVLGQRTYWVVNGWDYSPGPSDNEGWCFGHDRICWYDTRPVHHRLPFFAFLYPMPHILRLYGCPSSYPHPWLNDGWIPPAPIACTDLPDGDYTITVEARDPDTDELLAKGEVTITILDRCWPSVPELAP